MGACFSTSKVCVGKPLKRSKKKAHNTSSVTDNHKKRKAIKNRVSSRLSDRPLYACNNNTNHVLKSTSFPDRYTSNPTYQGGVEEAWYDSMMIFESDGEEDFQSVPDDILSQNGLAVGRNSHEAHSARNSLSDVGRNSMEMRHSVYLDEISSSVDDITSKEDKVLDHCGILPNNCLPCLNTTTAPSIEKRRSISSSPPSARKKVASKFSFKWRDGPPNSRFSSKTLLQRPLAGSQVPFSPIEKEIMNSWSIIEPNSFRVRGQNYFRDKKKDFAPNYAAYYPFGVDLFLSPRKIEHVARFVELPVLNSSAAGFPPILIVNAQVPLYPAALFQNEVDGEGINIVMYFKINEHFSKEVPSNFQEAIRRLMHDEVEKVKGFPMDSIAPFRERLKILGRLGNVDDLHLSAAEKKLINAYNEKPVLSRPQHEFFSGENYFEIDLDMHRFSYISRKGFEAFLDRLKMCILDFGLTIQGNKAEELPEQILCCTRLIGLDYSNYQQLGMGQDPLLN
ncbi:uncharacterized protein LOC130820844 [Amaranthus tricolor]|uniref:uncharacterized protein LOC130820844 n=1 Tax=Amaranthus tricolor TaxID=29722 RepID=UPI00258CD24C|nr:uncharacterized protein LOC130820844 [Amaranthus tricolor]XP_057542367.1 uncharacterized protein LOC130820844 [Amaranthus tricolor]